MAPVQQQQIKLIVGLGNPGSEYAETRHNAGFAAVDELARRAGITYWKSQCGADVATVRMRGKDGEPVEVVLAKPQAFMNVSGGPVSKLCSQHKVSPAELLVVHDETEIDAGSVRLKAGGGHAGHNGLRSIIDKLKTRDFLRLRMGVGRPPGRMEVGTFVLKQLKGAELDDFRMTALDAADACEVVVEQGVRAALKRFG